MAKVVTQSFLDAWGAKYGKGGRVLVQYKRRYLSGAAFVYEADWQTLKTRDFAMAGQIVMKLDTPLLNVVKSSNVSLRLKNTDYQWLEQNVTTGIFRPTIAVAGGFDPFLTKFRVQFGYKIAGGAWEMLDMFTGVAIDYIFDTGSAEVEVIVSGNEYLLQAAKAQNVSTAVTLENCSPALGDGIIKAFATTSTGAWWISDVQVGGVTMIEGADYTIGNLEALTPATIDFVSPPASLATVKVSLRKWLPNNNIETLVGLLADQAGITAGMRTINSVIFPGDVSGSKTIDTQADWEAGTQLTGIDTTSAPGSISFIPYLTLAYSASVQSFIVPAGVTSMMVDAAGAGPGGRGARVVATIAVTPGATVYSLVGDATKGTDIRIGGNTLTDRVLVAGGGGSAGQGGAGPGGAGGDGGLVGGAGTDQLGDGGGQGGGGGTQSAGGAGGGPASDIPGGSGSLGQGGLNGGSGDNGQTGGTGGGGYYGGGAGSASDSGPHDTAGGGGGGSSLVPAGGVCTAGYNTGNGYVKIFMKGYESAALNILSVPTAWGTLDRTETSNGGAVTYATSVSSDGSTWDGYVNISAGGVIQSALKQYFKIRAMPTFSNAAPVSPVVDKLVANFQTQAVNLSIAKFKGETCFGAIEKLAKLCNYEFGFDGSGNMYFRSKTVSGAPVVTIDNTRKISRITDFRPGYDAVINVGQVTYGPYYREYSSSSLPESAPTSEQRFLSVALQDDYSEFLLANDVNISAARARLIHDDNYRPKRRARLVGCIIPQADISDIMDASFFERPRDRNNIFGDPLQKWPATFGLPTNVLVRHVLFKIVGATIDPIECTGEYDIQEVLP